MAVSCVRVIATGAAVALLASGCELFETDDAAESDVSPTPVVTATETAADDSSDTDEPRAPEQVGEADPDLVLNLPDRPLSGTQIRIGLDVYTTNEGEPTRCSAIDGGIAFEADLVGPDHDTRFLSGQIAVAGEPDLVAVWPYDFDADWSVWAVQGPDAEDHTAGSFATLEADPDAGYVRGSGQFEEVVEHMMPLTDPTTLADAEFVITCG